MVVVQASGMFTRQLVLSLAAVTVESGNFAAILYATFNEVT